VGLDSLHFDNRFSAELPPDPADENRRRQVRGACYSRVMPMRMPAPTLVAASPEVGALLDLTEADLATQRFAEVFAGNQLLDGMEPYAACYGGHQFGNWAGQLGDGRAINLGEVVNKKGERWELQLKGAGPTPYSRMGDGRAVLRSSIREFLCSEAMHHLGVPTTRALSVVTTGDEVVRDMFYDGNPRPEPGAVVCRVAPSFIRFGNFEIFASRGEHDVLRALLDFTITRDFPELGVPSKDVYPIWLAEVCRRTAEMIVHWMRVGFVHGVMNTDNMSVLGLTIDYGPYGWLDDYDPSWTPNTTDASGRRYRYGNQPPIALWNLVQLANAIAPLVGETGPLEEAIDVFAKSFEEAQAKMIAQKLGLARLEPEDEPLVDSLFEALRVVETDMTLFFRRLADFPSGEGVLSADASIAHFTTARYDENAPSDEAGRKIADWLARYAARVRRDESSDDVRRARMNAVNPKYVLRNYLAQVAIDASEKGDHGEVSRLLEVMRTPYDEKPEHEEYAKKRPDWARSRPGCSMLSCSS
jgi:uncharacterized protein YdiU (UPF0061 family)